MSGAPYLVIGGPTGSGKSALALAAAAELGGEIISCDSVQVYRGFDLGSAKATAEERRRIPHHLLDVAEWNENFDAARFARAAREAIASVQGRGKTAIVVGGTGLYLRALLGQGFHDDLPSDPELRAAWSGTPTAELRERLWRLDPERATELHPNDRVRILRSMELVTLLGKTLRAAGLTGEAPADPDARVVILTPDRAELHQRIAARTEAMVAQGLVDEVRGLLARGVDPRAKPMQSIGYKQVAAMLAGTLGEAELVPAIMAATRQYAKRQTTWFKRVAAVVRLGEADLGAVLAHAAVKAPGLCAGPARWRCSSSNLSM